MRCASCQHEVTAAAKFCEECGAPLARLAPESYTPKHLAEKILTSKSALEGERKQVTVLFADIKSSMELLATRDPEQARELLDPVLHSMMEAVHHYEGTVNQVMGDGIMALFGAPLAHEDHAVRACYAALRMQQSVREAAAGHRKPVEIRIGLNSGDVVVRSIGSDLRMDYTAVGETTHLAARMEQMARPGSILVTARTLALAEGYVEAKSVGPVTVRGMAEPLDAYEVTAALPARTRVHAGARRGLTPFVGRRAELELLSGAVERAGRGAGQIVALVGEAGLGKSRLVWELTSVLRHEGRLVLEGGSVSYARTTPYVPVIALLRDYFQIEARDDVAKIREKVVGKVVSLDRTLEPSLAPILALLDVPVDDASWEALDPRERRQRTLDAVKRLLLREAQVQPVVLVIEDLHWTDSETQAVLDTLVDTIANARILLLVNYRPEYTHAWGAKSQYTQIRIEPLPQHHAEELLDVLLGSDPELTPVKTLLIERTEGNPFFLEESVRILIETRSLVREGDRYRLAQPLAAIKIPATVRAVLVARIDRLPETDKRLLQTAAVIGRHVPYALLREIAEIDEDVLQESLSRLQTAEFVYEARLFPRVEYVFKHALTQDVAYESLLQARRRTLHAEITAAIERLYPERLAEQVDVLAHHALAGELWEKSVHYLRRAGIKAASRSANRDAVERFEQALSVLERLPETPQRLEWDLDLRIRLGNCFWTLGEFMHMNEHVRAAETLTVALGDRRRLGQIAATRSHCGWLLGELDRAMDDGRRALGIAEELGDVALRIRATYFVGQGYECLGNYRRAVAYQREIIDLLSTQSPHTRFGMAGVPAVWCRFSLAWCLAELGDFAEADARIEEAIRIADVVDDALGRVAAYLAIGFVGLRAGRPLESIDAGQRALELCRNTNIVMLSPLVTFVLAAASTLADRASAGVAMLQQAVHDAASVNFLVYQPLLLGALSEAHLGAGRPSEARHHGQQALRLARARRERGYEAWALRVLGEIAARQQPADGATAERFYRDAIALGTELGMRPLVAQCRLGLGRHARASGDRSAAVTHFTEAAAMFAELRMRLWQEQAEQARADVS